MSGGIDPYGIVPDGFCEAYGEDTIPAALKAAERADSTSSYEEMDRCKVCGSVRIRQKYDKYQPDHKISKKYACHVAHHFDEPAPPLCELDIYTDTADLLDDGRRNAERLADALNTARQHRTDFEWIDPDGLDDEPDPGFSDELPDWPHGTRREAIRRAIRLSKPWSTDDGLSLRETAEYIPYSRAFVNSRRQEWRDGEHRDLVPAPWPDTSDSNPTVATDGGSRQ